MTEPIQSPIFAPALEVDPRVLCRDRGFVQLRIDDKNFNKNTEAVELSGDLLVELKVLSTRADTFWVEVSYRGKQVLTCSRKLTPFNQPIQETFEFQLCYSESVQDWKLEEEKEDYPVVLLNPQAKEFSVLEMVRQEIVLNEPLSPVENPQEDFGWEDQGFGRGVRYGIGQSCVMGR